MIVAVQSAPEVFEQTFLLTRAKILEIAATLDRLDGDDHDGLLGRWALLPVPFLHSNSDGQECPPSGTSVRLRVCKFKRRFILPACHGTNLTAKT